MADEITHEIISRVYPERPREAKKYDAGLLLTIGGSEFYSGAPALTALAAFAAGVDMVRVLAPRRAADIIAGFSPILAAFPLEGDRITAAHIPLLIEQVKGASVKRRGSAALAIGGGMGRSEETVKAICTFLEQVTIPSVLDVDALYAVAEHRDLARGKPFVLTPHLYEFQVLSGEDVSAAPEGERVAAVQEVAQELGATVLLKGATDIIADGNRAAVSRTGTASMTVGGTGDTLTGILAALLAKGVDPFLAASAAAFINGRAGELADLEKGRAMTPEDLIGKVPAVLMHSRE